MMMMCIIMAGDRGNREPAPGGFRRFPEVSGDFWKNDTSFLQVSVENRFLPFAKQL